MNDHVLFKDGDRVMRLIPGSRGNWVFGWEHTHIISEFMPKRKALSGAMRAWGRYLKLLDKKGVKRI